MKEEKIEVEIYNQEVELEAMQTEEEGDHKAEAHRVGGGEVGHNDGTVLGPHTVSGVWMRGEVKRQL